MVEATRYRCVACRYDRAMTIDPTPGGRYERCLRCGLEARIVPEGETSRESFDAAQDAFHGEQHVFDAPAACLIQRQFAAARLRILQRYLPGGKLLEVGPGGGELLSLAKSRGYEVAAVEHSPVLAERLRTSLGIATDCGMFEEVDLSGRKYDGIVSLHVIEHVPKPLDHLRAARAAVDPGGFLFLGTPNLASWNHRVAGNRWPGYSTGHLHLFNPSSLSNCLEQTGWRVVGAHTNEHVSHWPRTLRAMRHRPGAARSPQQSGALTKRIPYSVAATLTTTLAFVTWPFRRVQCALQGGYELLIAARA